MKRAIRHGFEFLGAAVAVAGMLIPLCRLLGMSDGLALGTVLTILVLLPMSFVLFQSWWSSLGVVVGLGLAVFIVPTLEARDRLQKARWVRNQVTVAEIRAGHHAKGSYYLRLTGTAEWDRRWARTTWFHPSLGAWGSRVVNQIPFVQKGWFPGRTVHVLLQIRGDLKKWLPADGAVASRVTISGYVEVPVGIRKGTRRLTVAGWRKIGGVNRLVTRQVRMSRRLLTIRPDRRTPAALLANLETRLVETAIGLAVAAALAMLVSLWVGYRASIRAMEERAARRAAAKEREAWEAATVEHDEHVRSLTE